MFQLEVTATSSRFFMLTETKMLSQFRNHGSIVQFRIGSPRIASESMKIVMALHYFARQRQRSPNAM
ncbi:hypothetical protein AMTR_s00006p00051690 [Amborella trichopoda]|uniref:Uncharacterized protein n=1 Tax=Amborella trichopoda TaxID=13333 RepID=W1PEW7_AMBTC|nr:hypothetical protein AMTR_s00006p00051690 [Amborella trichopoda]